MRSAVWIAVAGLFVVGAAETPIADFVDIASSTGFTARNTFGGLDRKDFILETTGNGVAIADFDSDGRNDVFIANGTRLNTGAGSHSLPQLYHNDGNGKFHDTAAQAGLTKEGWGQAVCVGDFDNDGRPDIFETFYGQNVLYRNRGDGKFEDVTARVGLPTSGTRYGSGCTFLDYDRDGSLDLFVSNYVDLDLKTTPRPGKGEFCSWKNIPVMCGPRGLPLAHNILYHNNGHGGFEDVSEAAGILKPGGRYSLGAVTADFDNDGWPDIYVACDMTNSLLFHNLHDGKFEERGFDAGVALNYDGELQAGMGIAVADYDGDGRLDIAKTNFSGDLTSLYHNDDGKFFTDVSRDAGLASRQLLGWGVAFLDVDDDGWQDLVIANGHVYPEVQGKQLGDTYLQQTVLFQNLGDGKFRDVSDNSGPAFRAPRPARGLAFGDLDGDGRPELVLVNMNAAPSVLKNKTPRGHFLNVLLQPAKSNRSAIGARVTVDAGGRKRIQEVLGGSSYYSQNSTVLHYGLGNLGSVDSITVQWPSGVTTQQSHPALDATVAVAER